MSDRGLHLMVQLHSSLDALPKTAVLSHMVHVTSARQCHMSGANASDRPMKHPDFTCQFLPWIPSAERKSKWPSLSSQHRSLETAALLLCSSIGSELEKVRVQIAAAAKQAGATVQQDEAYPGWNPDPTSKVLQVGPGLKGQLRLSIGFGLIPTLSQANGSSARLS